MTFPSRHLAWLLLLLVSPPPASARIDTGDPLAGQRTRFLEARAALKKADLRRFETLADSLADYPLYSYLDYARLRARLGTADTAQVRAFLDTWAEQPLAARLRRVWLRRLGQAGRWRDYLDFYTPQASVTLQCYRLRAELALRPRRRLEVLERALPLWLVGHSQPDACDPLFDALYASPLIDSTRIWQRIRLAFAANRTTLATWLGKRLSADDRRWVQRWRTAARQPVKALRQSWTHQDTPLVREILVHGLKRLARHKPEQAWKHWRRLAQSHRFSSARRGDVLRSLALAAARRNLPRAGEWLALVPDDAVDQQVRTWRVRAALLRRDWKDAAHWLDALKPAEQRRHEWRYWRAVAHERLGEQAAATLLYTDLAGERNFYGFLAADRLREPYRMNDRRSEPDSATLARVANLPGVVRARELHRAGLHTEARREWRLATAPLDRDELRAAALLAHRWGWHERAIATAARARYWSDLRLRFPLAHRELVFDTARKELLDPALIYGIIRQESAFMTDARSAAGALGLMQLMPATGRQTARALRLRYPGSRILLQSDHNVRIGGAYLRKLLDRFGGSPVLATAAYNAGPHRVQRWLPDGEDQEALLWLNRIPFRETREYVRRVLAFATVFEWRLQRPLTRLSDRLPAVPARDEKNLNRTMDETT